MFIAPDAANRIDEFFFDALASLPLGRIGMHGELAISAAADGDVS